MGGRGLVALLGFGLVLASVAVDARKRANFKALFVGSHPGSGSTSIAEALGGYLALKTAASALGSAGGAAAGAAGGAAAGSAGSAGGSDVPAEPVVPDIVPGSYTNSSAYGQTVLA